MSFLTPRMGMISPTPFDMMSIGDLILANNYRRIDATIGVTPVTSATRPASPIAGQLIYETDTELYQVWTGSAWTKYGSTNIGRIVAGPWIFSPAHSIAFGAETIVNGSTATFDLIAGKTYGFAVKINLAGASQVCNMSFRIEPPGGGPATTSSTRVINAGIALYNSYTKTDLLVGAYVAGATGTHNTCIGINPGTASGAVVNQAVAGAAVNSRIACLEIF